MRDPEATGAPSMFKLMHNAAALARMCPAFDLSFFLEGGVVFVFEADYFVFLVVFDY